MKTYLNNRDALSIQIMLEDFGFEHYHVVDESFEYRLKLSNGDLILIDFLDIFEPLMYDGGIVIKNNKHLGKCMFATLLTSDGAINFGTSRGIIRNMDDWWATAVKIDVLVNKEN